MSKAQSGLVNFIAIRAPGLGAGPSAVHSWVPERRMDNFASAAPVPLMSVKPDAPASACEPLTSSNEASKAFLMAATNTPAAAIRKSRPAVKVRRR